MHHYLLSLMSFQNRMPLVFYQKYFLKNCHIDFIFIQWQFIVATGCQAPKKKNHYKKPLKQCIHHTSYCQVLWSWYNSFVWGMISHYSRITVTLQQWNRKYFLPSNIFNMWFDIITLVTLEHQRPSYRMTSEESLRIWNDVCLTET